MRNKADARRQPGTGVSRRTLACGTGASSTAVACVLNGKTGRRVDVQIELGTLSIEWAADNHVYMTGPAAMVFEGDVAI